MGMHANSPTSARQPAAGTEAGLRPGARRPGQLLPTNLARRCVGLRMRLSGCAPTARPSFAAIPAHCVTGFLVVLLFGCARVERGPRVEARAPAGGAGPGPANEPGLVSPEANAGELRASPTTLKNELGFECRELGAEQPIADEPPGRGVPRLGAAITAGLPNTNVAYVSDGKIAVVSSDGQRRWLLGRGHQPRWRPRSSSLLFVSSLADHLPRLFETSTDCSALRMLTGPLTTSAQESSAATPDADAISYALSPDGERVAFTRSLDNRYTLHVVERATGNERKLADNVEPADIAWFPDSRSLAFIMGEAQDASIMSLELETGQARRLASVQRGLLAVLPDRRVLFQSAFDANNSIEARQARLYQLDSYRGAAQVLKGSELGPGTYEELRVSPDGAKLVASWSLWTGNGPAAIRDHGLALFSVPKSPPAPVAPADVRAPGTPFGPHGAILFTRPKAPNLSGSPSGERYAFSAPSWAPDSRHVVFELKYCGESLSECRSQIVAVDTATAQAPLVFLANGSEPAWASR